MITTNEPQVPSRPPAGSKLPSDKLYHAPNREVERRAAELAALRGRDGGHPTEEDLADARRELRGKTESLAGEPEGDVQEILSASRDPSDPTVSLGKVAPANMSAPDDEAGPVAEVGVDEAQHQLMLEARRQQARAERASRS